MNRDDYLPVLSEYRMLACLRCGLVVLEDEAALELHEVMHLLLAKLSPSGALSQPTPSAAGAGPSPRARSARAAMDAWQRRWMEQQP